MHTVGQGKADLRLAVHDGLGDLSALRLEITLDDRRLCGK
jgi:hypothetical protein